MVLVSALLTGMSLSLRLKRRRDYLYETVTFLTSAEIEIEYVSLPVFEILKKFQSSSGGKSLDFINNCINYCEKGEDFSAGWSRAVEASLLPMKKEEREKLISLGGLLGTSDTQGQRSILELFVKTFSLYCEKAEAEYEKYGRMIITVSGIIGMGIFIFLM